MRANVTKDSVKDAPSIDVDRELSEDVRKERIEVDDPDRLDR